jgi:hypothetical protein
VTIVAFVLGLLGFIYALDNQSKLKKLVERVEELEGKER